MGDNQQGGGAQNPNAGRLRADLVQSEIAARDLAKDLGYALESLSESQKILDKQAAAYKGLTKSSQLLNYLARDNVKFAQDLTSLYDSEVQVSSDLLLKKNMIGTQLRDDYAQLLTTYMLENDITDLSDTKVQLLVKQLKQRQEIAQKLEEERDLYETVAAKTLEIREEAESYKKSLKGVLATAREIGNDPKTMGAFMLTQAIKKTEKLVEGFEHFKEQGLTAGQAVEAQFKGMDLYSMAGLSDVKGVTEGMIQEFGNVNALSRDTTQELGKMAVHFGISGQEAAKLNASLSQIPGETAESAANAMEHVGAMAEMQGIAPGKIMKDMAANTGEMARAGAKGAEEFGKSVIELHKMGVEMQTASKIADGLLDFESSINAQNEASVLLGREINLDKARELALNNDLEGATKEVLKNVGSSAEFAKMNRLEQDALAKSAGMTLEELTKTLDAQEESNKYHGEGVGFAKETYGYIMEYGSKAAGFFKENGLLLLSTLQFLSMGNGLQMIGNGLQMAKNGLLSVGKGIAFATSLIYSAENREKVAMWAKQKAQWIAEKAHMAYLKTAAAFGSKGAAGKAAALERLQKMRGGGAKKDLVSVGGDDLAKTDEASSKMKGGGKGFKESMKGLAEGFKEMGASGVLKGIFNTFLAGPALLVAVAAIPFIAFMGLTPLKMLGDNFMNLAIGLEFMGTGKVALGSLNLMLFSLAAVVGIVGIPFMIMIAFLGNIVGMGLKGLAGGLEALAKPQVALGVLLLSVLAVSLGASIMMMGIGIGIAAAGLSLMFEQLANMPIENMLFMPIALQLMGIGLLTLGVAALIAGPGLLMVAVGLGLMVPGLLAISLIASTGAFDIISTGLVQMSMAGPGLGLVAMSLGGIAAGLAGVAAAGLLALPIFAALTALAAVGPALGALGGVFGGGGGEKEDKMDELISEVRALKAVMAQGGVINMDGKKVGDVLRLSISKTGVK